MHYSLLYLLNGSDSQDLPCFRKVQIPITELKTVKALLGVDKVKPSTLWCTSEITQGHIVQFYTPLRTVLHNSKYSYLKLALALSLSQWSLKDSVLTNYGRKCIQDTPSLFSHFHFQIKFIRVYNSAYNPIIHREQLPGHLEHILLILYCVKQ